MAGSGERQGKPFTRVFSNAVIARSQPKCIAQRTTLSPKISQNLARQAVEDSLWVYV